MIALWGSVLGAVLLLGLYLALVAGFGLLTRRAVLRRRPTPGLRTTFWRRLVITASYPQPRK